MHICPHPGHAAAQAGHAPGHEWEHAHSHSGQHCHTNDHMEDCCNTEPRVRATSAPHINRNSHSQTPLLPPVAFGRLKDVFGQRTHVPAQFFFSERPLSLFFPRTTILLI